MRRPWGGRSTRQSMAWKATWDDRAAEAAVCGSAAVAQFRGEAGTDSHEVDAGRHDMRGPQALKFIGQFGAMFHQTMVGASGYSKKSELIDELMIGIEDRRAVFFTYQSLRATVPVTYDIYPYGLAYHRGSLYLIGFAPDHREIRH